LGALLAGAVTIRHGEKRMESFVRNILCALLLTPFVPVALSAQNLEMKAPTDLSSRNRDALQVSRDEVRADRKNLVAKAIKLTDDEAQAFWPIYDQYATELTKINDHTVALIAEFADNYKNLPDQDAMRMITESLNVEQQKLATKQHYAQRFAAVLPGKKVARFFQLDRRLDAVVVLNLAQVVSLVE
jgi:hypothetical protein